SCFNKIIHEMAPIRLFKSLIVMKSYPLRLLALIVLSLCFSGFAYHTNPNPFIDHSLKYKTTGYYPAGLKESFIDFSKDTSVDNPGYNVSQVVLTSVPHDHSHIWFSDGTTIKKIIPFKQEVSPDY